jgi:hypothetical protein
VTTWPGVGEDGDQVKSVEMSFTAARLTPGALAKPIATSVMVAASEMRRTGNEAKVKFSTDETRGCGGGARWMLGL